MFFGDSGDFTVAIGGLGWGGSPGLGAVAALHGFVADRCTARPRVAVEAADRNPRADRATA